MSRQTINLAILASGVDQHAVAIASSTDDIAVARLPLGSALTPLERFRDRIHDQVMGGDPVQRKELQEFGLALFQYGIRDDLNELYKVTTPPTDIRLHLHSDRPEILALPWEYLAVPKAPPGPNSALSVVRIIPTIGVRPPQPRSFNERIRMLFVSAEPVDQQPVSWDEIEAGIRSAFTANLPDRFDLDVVSTATVTSFQQALAAHPYDVVHFSGHGDVDKATGEGCLLLTHPKTGATAKLPASRLAGLLKSRDIRLVTLSACKTGAGNFSDDYAVIAAALVRSGIPAVVANQLPVTDLAMAVFCRFFYTSLLAHGDVDRAMGEGRLGLFNGLDDAGGKRAVIEWGIPTLYRHASSAVLFTP